MFGTKSRRLRHARRRFSGRTLLSVCNMSLRTVGNRLGPSGHPQTLLKYAKTPPKRSNWAQKQRFGHLGEIGKISDFDLELRRRFCSDTAQLWKSFSSKTNSRPKKVWTRYLKNGGRQPPEKACANSHSILSKIVNPTMVDPLPMALSPRRMLGSASNRYPRNRTAMGNNTDRIIFARLHYPSTLQLVEFKNTISKTGK